ncbi:MAG TPA: VOC family protein [Bryobacteraceae bacterium]|nr:VOC family protein [Bryobacteraceae bacterium]
MSTTPSPLASARIVAFAATGDTARARAFYRDTLGLTLVSEDPFALVFDVQGIMLRVTPVKQVAAAPYTVLGWQVPDIAAAVAALSGAGVRFEHYGLPGQDQRGIWTAHGGAQVAWFQDPDGNLLSLTQF